MKKLVSFIFHLFVKLVINISDIAQVLWLAAASKLCTTSQQSKQSSLPRGLIKEQRDSCDHATSPTALMQGRLFSVTLLYFFFQCSISNPTQICKVNRKLCIGMLIYSPCCQLRRVKAICSCQKHVPAIGVSDCEFSLVQASKSMTREQEALGLANFLQITGIFLPLITRARHAVSQQEPLKQ